MQLDKMPSEAKPLLTAQTEKPNHYSYLKEFRVEQCLLFLQHKCTQHRPFTCFHWHFMNQRRRRPVRKRDGSFNYSADNYCTKYDETTGVCPDGDDCPFLHRTAGDTERRYHLRYYKTCMCVHDTDNRGFCVKNGAHCAFAHGSGDVRPPVYDIKEIQALENNDGENAPNGPNALDKERSLMNEDPRWQDTAYVLSSYKTEQCKRPPRLCRQGYACPQYHNSRDKRRSPRKFKYRSTPCPSVKHGDEWGEPTNCENGDSCSYCHTRTEQQFHPEIYKSTKCNDVQSAGYCPRGVFCAFAHIDQEMSIAREVAAPFEVGTPSLGDLLSNAIPSKKRNKKSSESSNGSGDLSECASTSSLGSNGSHSRAPGAQLSHRTDTNHINSFNMTNNDSFHELLRDPILGVENNALLSDSEKAQDKQNMYIKAFGSLSRQHNNSLHSVPLPTYDCPDVIGSALEELHIEESIGGIVGMERDFETDSPTISGLASSGMLGTSAPVNIPRSGHNSCLGSFSPTSASPLQHLQSGFLSANRFSHPDTLESARARWRDELECETAQWKAHLDQERSLTREILKQMGEEILSLRSRMDSLEANDRRSYLGLRSPHSYEKEYLTASDRSSEIGQDGRDDADNRPDTEKSFLNHVGSNNQPKLGSLTNNSLFGSSPLPGPFSVSPSVASGSLSELTRLREELATQRSKVATCEERICRVQAACDAWQREAEEANRKVIIAEQQRDEAMSQAKALQKEVDLLQGSPYLHGLRRISELKSLPLPTLKSIQSQLRSDLGHVDNEVYLQTSPKCMICEDRNRTVKLGPCNHYVLCSSCAPSQKNCPYCDTPIIAHTVHTSA